MYHKLFFFAILIVSLASCKNDFDLIEEGEEIPVVYGFVNLSDTAQYIRVERAFADENTNAFTLAQEADEVYYNSIEVKLTNQKTGSEFILEKVNAVEEGYTRDPGDFLIDPNFLYKIRTSELDFLGGEKVTLDVTLDDGSLATTSTTIALPIIELSRLPDDKLGFTGRSKNTIVQIKADAAVGLIGMTLFLYIRESLISDPTIMDTVVLTWDITSQYMNDPNRSVQSVGLDKDLFYQIIAGGLDKDKQVIRRFDHFDIGLKSSGRETLEFRRIALANSGLTGSLELPLYSNLSNGGIGIFSSKYESLSGPFIVTQATRDSLANGRFTKDLNFIF